MIRQSWNQAKLSYQPPKCDAAPQGPRRRKTSGERGDKGQPPGDNVADIVVPPLVEPRRTASLSGYRDLGGWPWDTLHRNSREGVFSSFHEAIVRPTHRSPWLAPPAGRLEDRIRKVAAVGRQPTGPARHGPASHGNPSEAEVRRHVGRSLAD